MGRSNDSLAVEVPRTIPNPLVVQNGPPKQFTESETQMIGDDQM